MTTTSTSDHGHDDDVHDLAALYVVDALDADEAERFAHHLPGCPDCQREVTELRTAGTALAVANAVPMPPGLRERVLAEVARQPQVTAPPGTAQVGPVGAGDPEPSPAAPPSPRLDPEATGGGVGPAEGGPGRLDPGSTGGGDVAQLDAARRRRRIGRSVGRGRALAVAAAAVVVLAGAAGALAVARGGGSGGNDRTAAEAAFAAVQSAPDARTLALDGVGGDGATVQVAWSASRNRLVLLADGMPDPGPGRTYELWRIDAGGPDPAGLFDPDGSGGAGLVAPLDGGDPSGWGVTVEPEGGSPAPTPPIVYQAEA